MRIDEVVPLGCSVWRVPVDGERAAHRVEHRDVVHECGSLLQRERDVGQRSECDDGDWLVVLRDEIGEQSDGVRFAVLRLDCGEIGTGECIRGVAPLARPFVALAHWL